MMSLMLALALQSADRIAIQGRLTDRDGAPVTREGLLMTLRLYGSEAGGEPAWSGDLSVDVNDGYFSSAIGPFEGLSFDRGYWVGVSVEGGAEMAPRWALSAAPYCLSECAVTANVSARASTSLGATSTYAYPAANSGIQLHDSGENLGVYATEDSASGRAMYGRATSSTGQTFGAIGQSESTEGRGMLGWATGSSGATMGVWGVSTSTGGRGVYGHVSATSGQAIGVVGQTDSTEGRGVLGWATASSGVTYGVWAVSASTGGYGVYAAESATSGTTYGVYAESGSTGGYGVYGSATAATGTTYGVYGKVNSASGWAGYFEGSVGIRPASGAGVVETLSATALDVRVNGSRVLRLEMDATSPNVIGGYSENAVAAGAVGATIGGGGAIANTNRVTDNYGTVGGGYRNQAGDDAGTVSDRLYVTVGGGYSNTASGYASTVGGGQSNTASGSGSTVGGGGTNTASDSSSTVGGGQSNTASASYSTVGGGAVNSASGTASTVGGGYLNTASGNRSTVAGGDSNTAAGDSSFAAGYRAKANHNGAFVWGDFALADVASTADNQFIVRASGGIWFGTTSAPSIPGGRFINTSTGAYLTTGGAWTNASDRNQKENIVAVDGREVLERLVQVPVARWNYRAESAAVAHLGPMAQDFYVAFGLGQTDTSIATVDADGVALAAIQGLYEVVKEVKDENRALRARIEALERSLGE